MTELHTDGNALAGLLAEVLAVDPTDVTRRCHSCGAEHPLAEHRAYQGAGVVLRCPTCRDAGVRIGVAEAELTLEWRGTFRVARP